MTTNSIADTLSTSLGLGYGINVSDLVSGLVSTTRAAKEQPIDAQVTTNNARISALASAKSSLTTFSTALTELLKSSDYSGQPASSNTNIASVSLLPNATGNPVGLPATLQVNTLAQAQVLSSATVAGGTAASAAGTGTLTLSVGGKDFNVTMTSTDTLSTLAEAINGQKSGVTASVVTDGNGARLVLKGATGTSNNFTVSTADGDTNLQRFVFDGNTANTNNAMTQTQAAGNAKISIDGVDMEFATNTVTTAVANLRIDLNSASPGTTVTLATDQPTSTMSQLVQDFVSTYNTMKTALNTATQVTSGSDGSTTAGTLAGDSGVRDMINRLSQLTSTQIASTGPYHTLADIGVSTQRDGTLSVDTDRLSQVLADNPDAVTQMLNPTTPTADSPGIAGALKNVTDYLNSTNGPLATSSNTYTNLQKNLQTQLDDLNTQMTAYDDQLTATYTAMSTQLTALKAQQTYLTQQIASWNSSSSG